MKISKNIKKLFLLLMVVLTLELTLFNFRYYETKLSRLEHKTMKMYKNNLFEDKDKTKKYSIVLDEKIKGIKVNIKQKNKDEEVSIITKFKDESSKYDFKVLDEIKYLSKYKNGEYITLNSQGKCIYLELDMNSNSNFNVESVELNTWYFDFNIFRVCMLIIISSIIIFKKEINDYFEKNNKRKLIVYILFIILSSMFYIYYSIGYHTLYENIKYARGSTFKDIYTEFTRSVTKGKITLDFSKEESKKLLNLKNYHDFSERVSSGYSYLYDAAFYKEKYYCYYGVTPVVTVLLPAYIITGKYFYSDLICIIYGTLIMIFILKIYLRILHKFKIKLGFIIEFIGYLSISLTMEIFFHRTIPNFYQAVDLCGIFWLLFALWQIMNLKNSKRLKMRLFLIGMSYGLMVLTRPLYVFYIVPILISIWKYIFKEKKINFKNGLAFVLPVIIMAIFQMCYNYLRFENIFEFGQIYQITINDTSSLKFDMGIAINGILSFLFNPPYFMRHFPFVGYNNAGVNNGNVIFSEIMFGIFWHPFLLILLTVKNRIKNNPTLKNYSIVLFTLVLLQLLVDITYAGIIQRYLSDVLPTLTLVALVYWFIYINESRNKETKNDRIKLYKIICIVTFIMMSMFMYISIDSRLLRNENKNIDKRVIDYNIRHSLEFYK